MPIGTLGFTAPKWAALTPLPLGDTVQRNLQNDGEMMTSWPKATKSKRRLTPVPAVQRHRGLPGRPLGSGRFAREFQS